MLCLCLFGLLPATAAAAAAAAHLVAPCFAAAGIRLRRCTTATVGVARQLQQQYRMITHAPVHASCCNHFAWAIMLLPAGIHSCTIGQSVIAPYNGLLSRACSCNATACRCTRLCCVTLGRRLQ
jgi:hypothetical protein